MADGDFSDFRPSPAASIGHLVENGFALHWLRRRSKAPFKDDWSAAPVYSRADLKEAYRPGYNVGVRLGEPSNVGGLKLYLLDFDIRDPTLAGEARAKRREILPEFESLPTFKSGSSGQSRHYYFLCDGAFRSKKLAHSTDKMQTPDGKWHWKWEIELFGTGKQAAIPPSIHPDTGNPYRWEREFDFDLLDMGLGPVVEADRVVAWSPDMEIGVNTAEDDDEDLSVYLHKQPMDLTTEEIKATLADLPLADWCDDRDGWLNAGMAIHHQFQGSKAGLQVWNDFSKQSKKYDERDQARVWKSFKVSAKSLRFAILLKAAADTRLQAELTSDGMDDDEDLLGDASDDEDDLLGDLPSAVEDDLLSDPPSPLSAAEKKDVAWVTKLDRNDEGAIKPTLHNLELMIRNDPRTHGVMALNLFTQEVVQIGNPGRKKMAKESPKGTRQLDGPIWRFRDPINGDLWTDEKDNAIRSVFEAPTRQGGYGIKVSDRDLKAAVDLVARERSFHPVREYLASQVWDGTPRLDTLFIRFLGAEDSPYSRSVSRLTLVGAVARVMEPGHKFDFATILEGVQGKGKSTFIEILAKHWFSELHGDFDDQKKMVESMQGSWILEIPELSGFSRADMRTVKAFISGKRDKVRLSYARRASVFDRQCILVGSTNDKEYLRDETGGRRFWPMACHVNEINFAGVRAEVDQLWAEAKGVYDEMRAAQPFGDLPLFLSGAAERDAAVRIQEDRRVETAEDGMAGMICAWLNRPIRDESGFDDDDLLGGSDLRQETCLAELWVECLRKDLASYGQIQAQQLGRAMKKVPGWDTTGDRDRTVRYGRQRVYRRII